MSLTSNEQNDLFALINQVQITGLQLVTASVETRRAFDEWLCPDPKAKPKHRERLLQIHSQKQNDEVAAHQAFHAAVQALNDKVSDLAIPIEVSS